MPDETTILGTAHIQSARQGSGFQRLTGRGGGMTGNVSASLKFDIPGLRDFKGQLDAINKSLDQLNATFTKLAKAPEAFSRQLENAVKQMKALQAVQVQGNRYVTTGTPPSRDPVGQAQAAAAGAGGGATGGAGGGASGQQQKSFVTQAMEAMFKRFDAGMQQAIASDVYASRMASYAGGRSPTTAAGIFRQQGSKGFGFMATDMTQANQVLYQGTGIGAYYGASGRPGQAASAYTTSIKQMQEVMPGLDATQGASAQTSIYGNVQGIKLARMMLGKDVSPYNRTGERKTQGEYFGDILKALQKLPRPNGQTGNWTKDEIMQMNFPGSRLNAWLSTILPEEAIPMWYEWAINNAAVSSATGQSLSNDPKVAKKQLEQVRGRSLATNAQEATNREAQKDATFAGQQYSSMNARLDYEKDMLGVLQSIDTGLKPFYQMLGRVPSLLQGPLAGGIGGLFKALNPISMISGLLGGDPGYMPMGDPEGSTSHLTPDLRNRVNAMMAANPNLLISSSYRDSRRQQSLQGRGPFAPMGKSKHGRGQAVDFGGDVGWLAKNARKFGLETASRYGEPWHVQLAGTTNMGDPGSDARALEAAQSGALISGITALWSAGQSSSGTSSSAGGSASNLGAAGNGGAATGTGGSLDLGKGSLTAEQIVQVLHNAGFSGDSLVTFAGIANRESGWTPSAHRSNQDLAKMVGDLGLLQINYTNVPALVKAGIITSAQDLLDPNKNAAAAFYLSKGGSSTSSWNAGPGGWTADGNPMYGVKQAALDAARQAASAAGYLGDVGYAPGMGGGGGTVHVGGGTTLQFNNTFQLSFPNGATRTSIDVATKQIAQRLEGQMRSVVSRDN